MLHANYLLMYLYGFLFGKLLTPAVTFFFTRDVCQEELVKVKMDLDQQKKTQGIHCFCLTRNELF